jgi:hypothetical protein
MMLPLAVCAVVSRKGLGVVLGRGSGWATAAATLALALDFQPLRRPRPAIGRSGGGYDPFGESRTTPVGEFRLSRFAKDDPIVSEPYVMAPES